MEYGKLQKEHRHTKQGQICADNTEGKDRESMERAPALLLQELLPPLSIPIVGRALQRSPVFSWYSCVIALLISSKGNNQTRSTIECR